MSRSKFAKITGWIALGVAIAGALALVFGVGLMWLWNWLIPPIFGLPEITYMQAVGLLVLCHILFKGHHHCPHHSSGERRRPLGAKHPQLQASRREENLFARKIHDLIEEDAPSNE